MSDDLAELTQRWCERGYVFFEWSNYLFEVWLLSAGGHDDAARELLIEVRKRHLDGRASAKEGRVASRLFHRLRFSTDDPDGWERLPNVFTVFRAGDPDGADWTIDCGKAEQIARRNNLKDLHSATVAKSDVLAFITGYGEDEVLVREDGLRDVRRIC